MNETTILNVLVRCGATNTLINESIIKHDQLKLGIAVAGMPVRWCLRGMKLGNCFYEYTEVVLNYTGSDESKPNGMSGKVEPFKVETIDGVTVGFFKYQIDSGG